MMGLAINAGSRLMRFAMIGSVQPMDFASSTVMNIEADTTSETVMLRWLRNSRHQKQIPQVCAFFCSLPT